MTTTIEGIFRDGHIEFKETPPEVDEARVTVTFLPEVVSEVPSKANENMLGLLKSWREAPLSPDDQRVLDDFDQFQARHPLRISRLGDEP